ncbi:unnamed protein product [Linum trigynum]|uniref:DUF4283 domain-containing protein n=1 Tax=Linum trigynum TaxID=586398 RepID=A0AAV2E9M7_9ROSI
MSTSAKSSTAIFTDEDLLVSLDRNDLSLIGRVFSHSPVSRSRMHHTVKRAWETTKPVVVIDVEHNLFQFVFDNKIDMAVAESRAL